MLTVQVLPMNMLEENCYIISDETREAVIVDCGALSNEDRKKITRYVSSQQLTLKHHICTHMHYDHCFGVAFIKETYQLSPEFHQADEAIYKGMGDEIFGALRKLMQDGLTPEAGKYLHEGDDISFGTHTLRVLETPGHTPGGICFYCEPEKALFSGDTLFYGSIGRTDFPGGNAPQLYQSIRNRIFTLPDDVMVYTGHGPKTQVGFEKQHNPYV